MADSDYTEGNPFTPWETVLTNSQLSKEDSDTIASARAFSKPAAMPALGYDPNVPYWIGGGEDSEGYFTGATVNPDYAKGGWATYGELNTPARPSYRFDPGGGESNGSWVPDVERQFYAGQRIDKGLTNTWDKIGESVLNVGRVIYPVVMTVAGGLIGGPPGAAVGGMIGGLASTGKPEGAAVGGVAGYVGGGGVGDLMGTAGSTSYGALAAEATAAGATASEAAAYAAAYGTVTGTAAAATPGMAANAAGQYLSTGEIDPVQVGLSGISSVAAPVINSGFGAMGVGPDLSRGLTNVALNTAGGYARTGDLGESFKTGLISGALQYIGGKIYDVATGTEVKIPEGTNATDYTDINSEFGNPSGLVYGSQDFFDAGRGLGLTDAQTASLTDTSLGGVSANQLAGVTTNTTGNGRNPGEEIGRVIAGVINTANPVTTITNPGGVVPNDPRHRDKYIDNFYRQRIGLG